eukprot:CAMPEP_0113876966 /NCGR_PEP_ID=MMETSP0780_2-20120614/5808_1 /TAXON_ID=652834 /ORGANISM="Palpitomonas bilix" /LENGTH=115 /DNA_ID=CAMNT_0000863159 /DNA_START=113 /DNA_END=456 /DNA_ORIENTATION=+ /assembly_acc=CAM_ASM_000599
MASVQEKVQSYELRSQPSSTPPPRLHKDDMPSFTARQSFSEQRLAKLKLGGDTEEGLPALLHPEQSERGGLAEAEQRPHRSLPPHPARGSGLGAVFSSSSSSMAASPPAAAELPP